MSGGVAPICNSAQKADSPIDHQLYWEQSCCKLQALVSKEVKVSLVEHRQTKGVH